MRAITVRQPHAWAIVYAGKVENRTRNIAGSYRGPVAIHAGLARYQQDNMSSEAHRAAHGTDVPTELVFGAIIGVADLVDVHQVGDDRCKPPAMCSPWALRQEDFPDVDRPDYLMAHLVFADPRPLATPIPYRGALGLWTLPDDVLAGAL